MAVRIVCLLSIVVAVALATEILEKAGTKPLGEACSAPMECLEPFYCLKKGDAFACGKKPCRAQDECRIGQFCGDSGTCEVPTCSKDGDCAGDTVCQVNKKCGAKGSRGQSCNSDSQCWSSQCTEGKCEEGSSENKTKDEDGSSENQTEDENGSSENQTEDEGILTNNPASNAARRVLGGGGIAGIITSILVLLALCCLCGFCFKKFSKKTNTTNNEQV